MTDDNTTETTRRNVLRAAGGAVALGAMPGAAAAQEATDEPEEDEPETASPTPEGEKVAVEIDPVTRLSDWEFSGGTFRLTMTCKTPAAVKITDSGAVMKAWSEGGGNGGATSIPTQGYSLSSGKTTISFDPVVFEEAAAVSIATAQGAAFVFSEGIEIGNPPVAWDTAQALLGGAVLGSVGGTVHYVKKKRDDEQAEVERVN